MNTEKLYKSLLFLSWHFRIPIRKTFKPVLNYLIPVDFISSGTALLLLEYSIHKVVLITQNVVTQFLKLSLTLDMISVSSESKCRSTNVSGISCLNEKIISSVHQSVNLSILSSPGPINQPSTKQPYN